jgi:hypothetical protein
MAWERRLGAGSTMDLFKACFCWSENKNNRQPAVLGLTGIYLKRCVTGLLHE